MSNARTWAASLNNLASTDGVRISAAVKECAADAEAIRGEVRWKAESKVIANLDSLWSARKLLARNGRCGLETRKADERQMEEDATATNR